MQTLTISLPDTVFSALNAAPDVFIAEMRIEAAAQWYAQGRISREKAASVAGISPAEFINALAKRRIAMDQGATDGVTEAARSSFETSSPDVLLPETVLLTRRESQHVLDLLENPPSPNARLLQAAECLPKWGCFFQPGMKSLFPGIMTGKNSIAANRY